MNSIYVLLITCLLYIFFGTIVDIIIGTNSSTQFLRIKTKVCFHTFIAPIMFGLVIFFILHTESKALNIFFGCGLIIGSLIRIFSTNRKYLTEFQIVKSFLNINYLTPFLKVQSKQFNLDDISNLEIVKANWIAEYPASVSFRHKSEWITFELIDQSFKGIIQTDIDAANMRFGKKLADEC